MSSSSTPRRGGNRVISYEEVVPAALAQFTRSGTVDMDELAAELAVSRATLYRVVDGRDGLLGDVVWALAEPTLRRARRERRARGVDGVLEVSMRFYEQVSTAAPFRAFLASEPQTAVRVLFTPAGGVHRRAVALQREILEEAEQESGRPLSDDLDDLAFLYVRIVESLLYGDLLAGRRPDLSIVERAARAVLTGG